MNTKRLFAIGCLSLLSSVVACGKVGTEHAEAAESFQKKVCDCADAACAKAVHTEFVAYFTKNKEQKVSKANLERIKAAASKFVECAKAKGDAEADKADDTLPAEE